MIPDAIKRISAACWRWRPSFIILLVVYMHAFIAGYWVCLEVQPKRSCEENLLQFGKFLVFANEYGILDRARLDEVVCIVSEGEWEDRDAEASDLNKPADADEPGDSDALDVSPSKAP